MALLEAGHDRKSLRSQGLWFVWWLAVTAIAAVLAPDPSGHGTHQQLGLPPCPSVLLFNRPCPGCGLTTSWTAFVHGHFAESFHAHPLGPALYLLFTASAVYALVGWFKGMHFSTRSPEFNRIMLITAVIFLGYGFTRMAFTPNFGTKEERTFVQIGR